MGSTSRWHCSPAGQYFLHGQYPEVGSALRWAVPTGEQYLLVGSTPRQVVPGPQRWFQLPSWTEAWGREDGMGQPFIFCPEDESGVWTPLSSPFMLGRHSLIINSKAIGTSTLYGAHLHFLPFLKTKLGLTAGFAIFQRKEFSLTSGMRLNLKK